MDALYPAQLSRPDLVVPRATGKRWSPRLVTAERRIWLAVMCAAIGVLIGESSETSARPYVLAVVAVLVVYALVGAVARVVVRRRQAGFEPVWLEAQSEILRGRRFEILRLTTSEPEETEHGRRTKRRVYDLARPAEVAELLRLRSRAAEDGVTVPVTVEFGYPQEDAMSMGVERVRGELASIPIVGRPGADVTPRVWFPDARYLVQPSAERAVTYWVLGPPSLMVAQPAPDPVPALSAEG